MNSAWTRPRRVTALLLALASLLPVAPALAIEEVLLELPLLQSTIRVKLSELEDPEALQSGNSDLAELDRATDGEVGRRLLRLFQHPVPISITQAAESSVGSPLLEQALLVVSSFGTIEGRRSDLSGETLREALQKAKAESAGGQPSLLKVMQAIPGERVRLNLAQAQWIAARMLRQRQQAEQLLASSDPAPVGTTPAPLNGVVTRELALPVKHRPEPLKLLVLQPSSGGNGRLVLVSHGLWDSPRNFQGWASVLAGQGYTVVLPWHPGSDKQQQHLVLNGAAPPPNPEELGWRGRDLIAVIDAVAADGLAGVPRLDSEHVVVLGHSWGATTALQLAGVRPSDATMQTHCSNVDDPNRNLSWALQCSWLTGVNDAALQDRRVIAVAAVSPPVSLLFPQGSASQLSGRVLLVSGSHDWVVPPDPEAVTPMRQGQRLGNQLVLVRQGDHFNLRPGTQESGGALGSLLLAWVNAAQAAGEAVRPRPDAPPLLAPGAWGDATLPLADVTPQLRKP